jgi:WD40 repeat protein
MTTITPETHQIRTIFRNSCMLYRLFAVAAVTLSVVTASVVGQDAAKAKVTYQEQVQAIFRNRCNSCHNADKQKGGLNLESYTTTLAGGSSGTVIEPGDPDSSTLLGLVMHTDEPKMPPNSAKIPDEEIATIRLWIEGGALDNSGSKVAMKAKPKFDFKLDPNALGKPAGEPAMPGPGLSTEPAVLANRSTAITAVATSPWAPLIAIGGHKQVLLYHADQGRLMAVLPFPEGFVYSLKFSRNGDLLLAGGGRGGQSGLAVGWDVKSGKRVFEVGKEYDVVLAADISPDNGMVAIGGPSRMVRVFSTADGELQFEMKKHTEWVTAVEFSPDGVLLATGDRNGGLIVWEGQTGREFYDLRGHTAMVSDVSWRLDSNVLSSSSEDGSVRLWEMENGNQIKTWGAHGGGTLGVTFTKDGRLVTTGRDRVTRLWDGNGGKQRDFEAFGDLALAAAVTHDTAKIVGSDYLGEIRQWDINDGARLLTISAVPLPVAQRLPAVKTQLEQGKARTEPLQKELAAAEKALVDQTAAASAVEAKMAPLQDALNKANAAAKAAADALAATTAAETKAQGDVNAVNARIAAANEAKKVADAALATSTAADATARQAAEAARGAIVASSAEKAKTDQQLSELTAAIAKAPNRAEADKLSVQLNDLVIRSVAQTTALSAAVAAQAQKLSDSETASAALAAATVKAQAAPAAVAAATAELPPLQDVLAKSSAAKNVAAQADVAAKAAVVAATGPVNGLKPELDKAVAARTAATAARDAKKKEHERHIARVAALEIETKALDEELKSRPVGPGPVAAKAN